MGWRRNRSKQRQKQRGGQQPDLIGRKKKRHRDPMRVAAAKQAEIDRPGPLMAERQARIAAQAAQEAQGRDIPAPGAQTVDSRNGASGSAVPQPQQGGDGGNAANGNPDTALFERPQETRSDAIQVRRAVKRRWETDKRMSEAILTKIGIKALQDDQLSMPQLLGAGKLMLDIERQNQAEEHHTERMDYAERALQMRAKVGQYKPPVAGAMVETAGPAKISIYLPDNQREADDLDADIDAAINMPLRDEMAGEQP